MRWDALFADLEGELAAAEAAERSSEIADRTRRETGRIGLVDRLRPAVGASVRFTLLGGTVAGGRLRDVGPDWAVVTESGSTECLVRLSAVTTVVGVPCAASEPGQAGRVWERIDVRHALRALVRDRAPVALALVNGAALTGTLDAVGCDVVELATHPVDEPRRAGAVRARQLVPLPAIAAVRR